MINTKNNTYTHTQNKRKAKTCRQESESSLIFKIEGKTWHLMSDKAKEAAKEEERGKRIGMGHRERERGER